MASEIRVNTFKNRSGLGTVSINDTGASFSGVVTATSGFSGDLTGNVTGNLTGNVTGDATGLSGSPTLSGITSVSTTNLTVNGNAYPATGPLSNRNLIINGAMQVAQRGTTITDVGVDTFMLDRWKQFASVGGQAGRSTATQEAITDLEGFRTALKLQVTTAETPAANEVYTINTRLEAQDILGLDIGGSNSKSLTLSFWAKAPTGNGTFCAGITMNGGGHYVEEVTIGTTWSRHIINIPATTTSSHATTSTGNTAGMEINITLMAGDTFDNATNGVWGSGTGNRATSNQTNFYSSTSNNLWITGVQLEVGSVATPFEHRSYGDELARCQRYYYRIRQTPGHNCAVAAGSVYSTTQVQAIVHFPVSMREAPSALEQTGTAGDYDTLSNGSLNICDQVPVFQNATTTMSYITFNYSTSTVTAGSGAIGRLRGSTSYLAWSSEL